MLMPVNANRLREGIGLPTPLAEDPQRDTNRLRTQRPPDARKVLASRSTGDGDYILGWLWRGRLRDYYRQSLAWQGWLSQEHRQIGW